MQTAQTHRRIRRLEEQVRYQSQQIKHLSELLVELIEKVRGIEEAHKEEQERKVEHMRSFVP